VRRGDTLWDIVKLYDGVTVTEVMSLNNINNASRIAEGQKLKIPRKTN